MQEALWTAYVRLLSIPWTSRRTASAQADLCMIRDALATHAGIPSRFIQEAAETAAEELKADVHA